MKELFRFVLLPLFLLMAISFLACSLHKGKNQSPALIEIDSNLFPPEISFPSHDDEPKVSLNPYNEIEKGLHAGDIQEVLGEVEVSLSSYGDELRLSHNSDNQIENELHDRAILEVLGKASDLTLDQIQAIDIHPATSLIADKASKQILKQAAPNIGDYIRGRTQGHTMEYMVSLMNSRASKAKVKDPDLAILLKEYRNVAPDFVRKYNTGKYTGGKGEMLHYVSYVVSDGDVAWVYQVSKTEGGAVTGISEYKYDSKDFDPKYADVMKEVDAKVEARMKAEKVEGMGSCHFFWDWKKELLKERGIEWHSRQDLTPNACFD